MEFALAYIAYWSEDDPHCAVYETVPDEGAKCYVVDGKGADAWPEEVRMCLLNNDEYAGENFKSLIVSIAAGETVYSEALGNCSPPSEEPGYVSTCDFGAANWESNPDCITDIVSYSIVLAFFGGFFGLIVVIILAVVL